MPREALNTSASKPGAIWVSNSSPKAGARAISAWGAKYRWGDFVYHLKPGVAKHAFSPHVEDLDHAFSVGGDAGKVGTVEDGTLQRFGASQGLLPVLGVRLPVGSVGIDVPSAGRVGKDILPMTSRWVGPTLCASTPAMGAQVAPGNSFFRVCKGTAWMSLGRSVAVGERVMSARVTLSSSVR